MNKALEGLLDRSCHAKEPPRSMTRVRTRERERAIRRGPWRRCQKTSELHVIDTE